MRRASSVIAFAIVVGAMPLTASADTAFTLRDVDVFTGPGSEYPPVATLPPDSRVDVAGCLSDWSWCDVIFADSRGWVYAGDLGYPYQNNRVVIIDNGPRLHIPVVAFSLPTYWDALYRDRPWYRERDVWVNRVHAQVDRGGRPPEGRAGRAASASTGGAPSPSSGVSTPPQGQPPQGQPTLPGQQPQYAQPRQPAETMQRPNATQSPQAAPSLQSGRAPEARPPDNRPDAGRPSEGRPPEGRPAESQGQREAGPSADRGEREGKGGEREGKGSPQGRGGDNGPDRDRQ